MEKDIKQIIKDILFDEEPLEDASNETLERKEEKVEPAVINNVKAQDIIYRNAKSSVFVDLNNNNSNNNHFEEVNEPKEVYEFSSNISPIFGVIEQNDKHNVISSNIDKDNDSLTKKPSDNHLDIVPSPIYGYGSKEEFYGDDLNDEDITRINVRDEYDTLDREINLFDDYGDK